jgi:hypothetical protein
MKHMRPACSQCAYWVAEASGNPPITGHCHRYPPGVYVNSQTGVVVQKFPTTDHLHWCGEWQGDDQELVKAAHRALLKRAVAPV